MRRKFLSNLIFLLFLNLLVKPFWILGIDRSVQNVVGAEGYGFYYAILNFSFLFNILLDFGITNFNNRNIARHNHLLGQYLPNIIVLKTSLAVLYAIIVLASGLAIGYNGKQLQMLALLGINQFLLSFILYLRSNINGLLLLRTDSMLSVLDRLIVIAIMSILLWGNVTQVKVKIEWYVLAQTAAYTLTAITALIIVLRKTSLKLPRWNSSFIIQILKQSYPFAILVLLMTFYNRIDSVMIERLLPHEEGCRQAGIYASANRLLEAANMIALLFAGLLLPIFSKMTKEKESPEKLARMAFTILLFISITVAIISFFYSDQIMYLLYSEHQAESAIVFRRLMFGFVAISSTYVFGTLLTANGNLKQLNMVAASGILINLGMNLILIPFYKAAGAAIASIVTQFMMAFIQFLLVMKIFRFRFEVVYLFKNSGFIAGIFTAGFLSTLLHWHWIVNIVLFSLFSAALAISLRLISFKSFFRILRTEQ